MCSSPRKHRRGEPTRLGIGRFRQGNRVFVVMPAKAGIQQGWNAHANRFWRLTQVRPARLDSRLGGNDENAIALTVQGIYPLRVSHLSQEQFPDTTLLAAQAITVRQDSRRVSLRPVPEL